MGWFTYKCKDHGDQKLSLMKREKIVKCPLCGKDMFPVIKSGTVSVVERLDNGVMGRAVERLHNIEEIMEERADKHTREFEKTQNPED